MRAYVSIAEQARRAQIMYGSVENLVKLRPARLIVTKRKPRQDQLQVAPGSS